MAVLGAPPIKEYGTEKAEKKGSIFTFDDKKIEETTKDSRKFWREFLTQIDWGYENHKANQRELAAAQEMWYHRQAKRTNTKSALGPLRMMIPAREFIWEIWAQNPDMSINPWEDKKFCKDWMRLNPNLCDKFA